MKKYITVFATSTLFFISCQKEIIVENGTNPTPTPSLTDTILLRKFIVLDTTQTAPNDTIIRGFAQIAYNDRALCRCGIRIPSARYRCPAFDKDKYLEPMFRDAGSSRPKRFSLSRSQNRT